MAHEPVDEFFTNLFIHSQIKQKKVEEQKMQQVEAEMRAKNV